MDLFKRKQQKTIRNDVFFFNFNIVLNLGFIEKNTDKRICSIPNVYTRTS